MCVIQALTFVYTLNCVVSTTLAAQPNPNGGGGTTVWSQKLSMGTTYRVGFVVNTSRTSGFVQLYFNGNVTMITPGTRAKTASLASNFFPGRADPKFGLCGGKNYLTVDSYIYDAVIGTSLADVKDVAGIMSWLSSFGSPLWTTFYNWH